MLTRVHIVEHIPCAHLDCVLFHKGRVLFDCNRRLVALSLASFCSLSSLTSGDSSRCLLALYLATFFSLSFFSGLCVDSDWYKFV